ncbi:M23 family metallopeptidase [Massilia sp. PAMC28688]|uniref:M23 family metallopeptidase n=1 Tax=Massilia sp. PAMC28688 TaxID=2861283 RepID=UPI001C63185F|nr:M23 family metallopeptidase [Massilia sp. PAMC28688]QYF95161.1 M23 family metallopeptidase [Massilia sp. PAMC28688]
MFRRLVVLILFCALAYAAYPWLSLALYGFRLASMPLPSSLNMPVEGVEVRQLRDTWQAFRTSSRRHEGIDIFAARGTPVRASVEGIILRIEETNLGGKVVWVMGPGNQRHYYAHLDRIADIKPGQRVQAGSLLGYVGNTGNAASTPPHLHYGVYGAGGAINPFPLLAGAQARAGSADKRSPRANP